VHAVPRAQTTVTAESAANPVPENVGEVPSGPSPAETERAGATAKVALAEWVAVSVASNCCDPSGAGGTSNVQPKLPFASVVGAQTAAEPQVTSTGSFGPNPVPERETEVPTGPELGPIVRADSSVNDARERLPEASVAVNG